MPRTVHLFTGDGDASLAVATIARQIAAGDAVTVVALHGAAVPPLPAGVPLQRVPEELSYDALLQAVFEADQVVAW
jgi:hypothetical protein